MTDGDISPLEGGHDVKLLKALARRFNALERRQRLGACHLYAGEQKSDGAFVDLFVPTDETAESRKDRDALAKAFRAYVATGSINLPDYHQVMTDIAGSHGKVPVLVLARCEAQVVTGAVEALSPEARLSLFADVARGLADMHGAGIVHGNISDRAVRRESGGIGPVKLCDPAFSLGRQIAVTGQPLAYQSPEILTSSSPSYVSDLHALGVLGYRLFLGPGGAERALTGQDGEIDPVALRTAILDASAPAPRAADLFPEGFDRGEAVAAILARLIGRSGTPFPDGRTFLQALDSLGGSQGQPFAPAATPLPSAPPPPIGAGAGSGGGAGGGRKLLLGGLAVVALAAVLGGGWYAYDQAQRQRALDAALAGCAQPEAPGDLPAPLAAVLELVTGEARARYDAGEAAMVEAICQRHAELLAATDDVRAAETLRSRLTALAELSPAARFGHGEPLRAAGTGAVAGLDAALEALAKADLAPLVPAIDTARTAAEDLDTAARAALTDETGTLAAYAETLRLDPARFAPTVAPVVAAVPESDGAGAFATIAGQIDGLRQDMRAAAEARWIGLAREEEESSRAMLDLPAAPEGTDAAQEQAAGTLERLTAERDSLSGAPFPPEAGTRVADWDALLAAHGTLRAGLRDTYVGAARSRAEALREDARRAVDAARPEFAEAEAGLQAVGAAAADRALDAVLADYREAALRFEGLIAQGAARAAAAAALLGEALDAARAAGAATASDETAAALEGASEAGAQAADLRAAGNHLEATRLAETAAEAAGALLDDLAALQAEAETARDIAGAARTGAETAGATELEGFAAGQQAMETAATAAEELAWAGAARHWVEAATAFDGATGEMRAAAEAPRASAETARTGAETAGATELESFAAGRQAMETAATAAEGLAWAEAAQRWTEAAAAFDAAIGEMRAASEAPRAAAETARTGAETADATELEGFAAGQQAMETAAAAAEAGAWAAAAQGWTEAAAAFDAATGEMRAAAAAARAEAVLARAEAEPGADLEGFAAGVARFDAGEAATAGARHGAARAAYQEAAGLFRAVVTELTTGRRGPRRVALGSDPAALAQAVGLCRSASPVPAACPPSRPAAEGRRTAELTPFALDATEVTVGAFAAFVRATGYRTDAERNGQVIALFSDGATTFSGYTWSAPTGPGSVARPADPVSNVSYNDARAYCEAQGQRLPTADEWEYTARGGAARRFPWGDDWRAVEPVWRGNPQRARASLQPASVAGGATPEGHLGLAGNLREWVSLPGGAGLKGGSWLSFDPADLRGAAVVAMTPDTAGTDFGFRCATDLEEWK